MADAKDDNAPKTPKTPRPRGRPKGSGKKKSANASPLTSSAATPLSRSSSLSSRGAGEGRRVVDAAKSSRKAAVAASASTSASSKMPAGNITVAGFAAATAGAAANTAADAAVPTTAPPTKKRRGRPPSKARKEAAAAAAAGGGSGGGASVIGSPSGGDGRGAGAAAADGADKEGAPKKSYKKTGAAGSVELRAGSRLQPQRGARVELTISRGGLSVYTAASSPKGSKSSTGIQQTPGPASAYPKRVRNAPDVFKAGPSTKSRLIKLPVTPPPPPAKGGGKGAGIPGVSTSEKKASAKKTKAPKKAGPPQPPPPPPPPPPYRFKYAGWPVIGGRELISVGVFINAALPVLRFGRNYEVRMRELEQAVASPRPMESSLLGMIHARLLASRKELKAMRVGEDKFPYSFWTERLKQRLAEWYLRRSILRELIEDAERPESDGDLEEESGTGSASPDVSDEPEPQESSEQATDGDASEAMADVPPEGTNSTTRKENHTAKAESRSAVPPTASTECGGRGGVEKSKGGDPMDVVGDDQTQERFVSGRRDGVEETRGRCDGGGHKTEQETEGRIDKGVEERKDCGPPGYDVEKIHKESVVAAGEMETGDVTGEKVVVKKSHKKKPRRMSYSHKKKSSVQQQRPQGGGHMEGEGGGKMVSAERDDPWVNLCRVCFLEDDDGESKERRKGKAKGMATCHYEKCSKKFHVRCLDPPLAKIPSGQWYCKDCRAAKRVYGCNACMQNDRPEEILQCDGPQCGLEYHMNCLNPPLDEVPDVDWWYCPDCVRTDNRVGCRVCKEDVDYHLLMKCDGPGCDLEWHTYCLNPPLKAVPAGAFICPTCKHRERKALEKSTMQRERDLLAANERRRRRMARKLADLETAHHEKYTDGKERPPDLRLSMMYELDMFGVEELKLQLHQLDILLRNIEDVEDLEPPPQAPPPGAADTGDIAAVQAPIASNSDRNDGGGAASTGKADSVISGGVPAGGGTESGEDGKCGADSARDGDDEGNKATTDGNDAGKSGEKPGEQQPEKVHDGGSMERAARLSRRSRGSPAVASGKRATGGASTNGRRGSYGKRGRPPGGRGGAAGVVVAGGQSEAAKNEEKDSGGEREKKSPMADKPYEMLSVAQRVGILCALCESLVDDEHVRQGAIDMTFPESMRMDPFGRDSAGRLYFRFNQFWKEMRVYRTVEGDSPIPAVDDVAIDMANVRPPEPASINPKHQRLRGGCEMELVADDIEGMSKLAKALGRSKSKNEEDDARLRAFLVEEVGIMKTYIEEIEEKEEKRKVAEANREKKALLAMAPKRRSGRLTRGTSRWTEARSEESKVDDSSAAPHPPRSPSHPDGEGGFDAAQSTAADDTLGDGDGDDGGAGGGVDRNVSNNGSVTAEDAGGGGAVEMDAAAAAPDDVGGMDDERSTTTRSDGIPVATARGTREQGKMRGGESGVGGSGDAKPEGQAPEAAMLEASAEGVEVMDKEGEENGSVAQGNGGEVDEKKREKSVDKQESTGQGNSKRRRESRNDPTKPDQRKDAEQEHASDAKRGLASGTPANNVGQVVRSDTGTATTATASPPSAPPSPPSSMREEEPKQQTSSVPPSRLGKRRRTERGESAVVGQTPTRSSQQHSGKNKMPAAAKGPTSKKIGMCGDSGNSTTTTPDASSSVSTSGGGVRGWLEPTSKRFRENTSAPKPASDARKEQGKVEPRKACEAAVHTMTTTTGGPALVAPRIDIPGAVVETACAAAATAAAATGENELAPSATSSQKRRTERPSLVQPLKVSSRAACSETAIVTPSASQVPAPSAEPGPGDSMSASRGTDAQEMVDAVAVATFGSGKDVKKIKSPSHDDSSTPAAALRVKKPKEQERSSLVIPDVTAGNAAETSNSSTSRASDPATTAPRTAPKPRLPTEASITAAPVKSGDGMRVMNDPAPSKEGALQAAPAIGTNGDVSASRKKRKPNEKGIGGGKGTGSGASSVGRGEGNVEGSDNVGGGSGRRSNSSAIGDMSAKRSASSWSNNPDPAGGYASAPSASGFLLKSPAAARAKVEGTGREGAAVAAPALKIAGRKRTAAELEAASGLAISRKGVGARQVPMSQHAVNGHAAALMTPAIATHRSREFLSGLGGGSASAAPMTPPAHGMSPKGALDIMALAASSRPRAATTPSTGGSPRGASGGGSRGAGATPASFSASAMSPVRNASVMGDQYIHFSPPRGVSSALDLMAEAVQAREPAPLLRMPGRGGGEGAGGTGGTRSNQGPFKKPRV